MKQLLIFLVLFLGGRYQGMITPEEKRQYDEARENPHESEPLIDLRSDEEKEAAEQGRRDGLTDEVIRESKQSGDEDDD